MTFPLLSDPDSAIIERFGILNTLIDPDDHPWYGIPFPGVYVTDADGVIIAEFFESALHFRPSAGQLLRAALGEPVAPAPMPAGPAGEVAFDVMLEGDVLRAGILHDLLVRFSVPDGQHLYGDPVPPGMVATSVELDDAPGLVVKPTMPPPTRPLTLAGTGETLQVFDGDVVLRVPVTHVGRSLTRRDDGSYLQSISGTVRWQACDEHTCRLPRTERFTLEVPAAPVERPEAEFAAPGGMDVATHLRTMVARRTDRPVGEILAAMTDPDAQ